MSAAVVGKKLRAVVCLLPCVVFYLSLMAGCRDVVTDEQEAEKVMKVFSLLDSAGSTRIRACIVEQWGPDADTAFWKAAAAFGKALNEPSALLRFKAVKVLGAISGKLVVPPLIRALRDQDRGVRSAAVKALSKIKDKRAISAVIGALKDQDENVRHTAAQCLAHNMNVGEEAVEPLITVFKNEKNEHEYVRAHAAIALGSIGDKRAFEPLLSVLENMDESIRGPVASALGELGDKRAVTPLIAALEDDDLSVRSEAARALGNIGDVRAIEPLVGVLSDKRGEVRVRGVHALASIGKPALGKLIEALGNEYKDVRLETVRLLGYLREKAAIPHLIEALKNKNGDLYWRVSVIYALGEIGEPAVEPLIEALEDEDDDVRYFAADALKQVAACHATLRGLRQHG
jgi:HEAT repeat protein